jgi:anti-sigma regulatory factor (Ser/Thr protein kinase)
LPNPTPSCHMTAVAYRSCARPCRLSSTQARKGRTPMPSAVTQADIMIALVLARDPGQVGITRCLVRAALEYRGLGHYAPEAEIIASELVTNAIQHARSTDPADKIGVTLIRVWDGEAVSVVVTDSSPLPRSGTRRRPRANKAEDSRSWRRCPPIGAGTRNRAARPSTRSSRTRDRRAGYIVHKRSARPLIAAGRGYSVAWRARSRTPAVEPTYMSSVMR